MLFAVDGLGLLGAIGIGLVLALIVWYFASQADEKAVVRSSLRQLEGYEVENVRDRELLNPLRERAIVPAVKGLTDIGRRVTPAGYVEGVRKKFIYAGDGSPDAVDRFLAIRVVTIAAAVIGVPLIWAFSGLTGNTRLAVVVLFG